MLSNRDFVVFGIAVFVFIVAIVGVIVARVSHRDTPNRFGGWLALACIIVVGAVSMHSMEACGRYWLVFTTTLPLMAVGFTIDLRKSGHQTAY